MSYCLVPWQRLDSSEEGREALCRCLRSHASEPLGLNTLPCALQRGGGRIAMSLESIHASQARIYGI